MDGPFGQIHYWDGASRWCMRPDFAFHAINGGGIDILDQSPIESANAVADFLGGVDR